MTATKTSAPDTVKTEATAPAVDGVTDKQAAEQLRVLYASYPGLRRDRGKCFSELAEAKVAPIAAHQSAEEMLNVIQKRLDDSKVAFIEWMQKVQAFMQTLKSIGESNPNASIRIITKSGRTRSVNGEHLFSAFAREEAEILGGTLA